MSQSMQKRFKTLKGGFFEYLTSFDGILGVSEVVRSCVEILRPHVLRSSTVDSAPKWSFDVTVPYNYITS